MRKKNIIIFLIVLLLIISISYFMTFFGVTDKLRGEVYELKVATKEGRYTSDLPVISMVVNSSGGRIVNDSVALTISAESNCNIKRLEYSTDLKSWTTVSKDFNNKKIITKIVFDNFIYGNVYIRVINEKGYRSYAYETSVKIDKSIPSLKVYNENGDTIIKVNDNIMLASIQYSNDKINWDEEEIFGEAITLRKNNINYKYVRAVDIAGNISLIKKIDN